MFGAPHTQDWCGLDGSAGTIGDLLSWTLASARPVALLICLSMVAGWLQQPASAHSWPRADDCYASGSSYEVVAGVLKPIYALGNPVKCTQPGATFGTNGVGKLPACRSKPTAWPGGKGTLMSCKYIATERAWPIDMAGCV